MGFRYGEVLDLWRRWTGLGKPRPETRAARGPVSPAIVPRILEQALRQVELLRASGRELQGAAVLEVGTGSAPVVPLIYGLAGAGEVILADHVRSLDRDLLVRTAFNLRGHSREIAARLGQPERDVLQRLRVVDDETVFAALRQFRMQYLAPYDLLEATLPDHGLDVVTGSDLLQHFGPRYLRAMMPVIGRLLRPEGVLCHCVERADRLAAVALLRETGFGIVTEETEPILRVVTGDEPAVLRNTPPDSFLLASWRGGALRADER
ncbi:MAG: hypothetical protein IPH09_17545 [bacterium]|nr:hypothetical protein [bacterium]